jgi:arylsulfatase A-like enzyme
LSAPGPAGGGAAERRFLWVHLFEPHAPYGHAGSGRPIADRYDDEIAESDAQVGRILEALGTRAASALVVVASDHGEAFGEHGEVSHSLFVYDTTLRVPLIIAGPGVPARTVGSPVSLVDVAPTLLRLLGVTPFDSDGIDLAPALAGADLPARDLYAESFAPLLDFGWSPLRALRAEGMKFIAAPRPELFDLGADAGETTNLAGADRAGTAAWSARVDRISPPALAARPEADSDTTRRLRSLGYAAGATASTPSLADPKDRREVAAKLAQVTSGEVTGTAL